MKANLLLNELLGSIDKNDNQSINKAAISIGKILDETSFLFPNNNLIASNFITLMKKRAKTAEIEQNQKMINESINSTLKSINSKKLEEKYQTELAECKIIMNKGNIDY